MWQKLKKFLKLCNWFVQLQISLVFLNVIFFLSSCCKPFSYTRSIVMHFFFLHLNCLFKVSFLFCFLICLWTNYWVNMVLWSFMLDERCFGNKQSFESRVPNGRNENENKSRLYHGNATKLFADAKCVMIVILEKRKTEVFDS